MLGVFFSHERLPDQKRYRAWANFQFLAAAVHSLQGEPLRTRQAFAVVRAAVETERDRAAARWIVRRAANSGSVLLARDELSETGAPAIDGKRLADYAEALGRRADDLAREGPLRPLGRALDAIQSVEPPSGLTRPAANRLLQLAAAVSQLRVPTLLPAPA